MAKAPWGGTVEILSHGGLEAIASSYLASAGKETIRQVVFQRYPSLPIGEKNYLVGLTGSFLRAGQQQQSALLGTTISLADIPINMGLGGPGGSSERFRYMTDVGMADATGRQMESRRVDVLSPIELSSADLSQAAEAQLAGLALKYPKLAKFLRDHPLPTGVTIIGIERAF